MERLLTSTTGSGAEMLLTGEKRLLGMIASGASLAPILDALCRLFEELSDGSLSSILFAGSEKPTAFGTAQRPACR